MKLRVSLALMLCVSLIACADEPPEAAGPAEGYAGHAEPADFTPTVVTKSTALGVPASFDGHTVMDDGFLNASDSITVGQLQAFLERTPYGNRSWIADATVPDGRRAAEAIIAACQAYDVNPIAVLARMQVEQRAISTTSPISTHARDYTLGCGCPDNRPCNTAYRGLYEQVLCGARTMRGRYEDSEDGSGQWRRGHTKSTLDGYSITPTNHATAAMYAYTPWRGSSSNTIGNWLVWNITLKYARHFADLGVALPGGNDPSPPSAGGTWIGEPCAAGMCSFSNSFCLESAAGEMCSQSCEGYCPDRSGAATTFCVDAAHFGGGGGGVCTVKAESRNGFCGAIGMEAKTLTRFVGGSGAPGTSATVCVFPAAPAPSEPPMSEPPESDPPPSDPPSDPTPSDPPPAANPPAGDVPPEGDAGARCVGQVAHRTLDGATDIADCAAVSLTCGAGFCLGNGPSAPASYDDARCATLDYTGKCEGQIAVYCDGYGNFFAQDCAEWGSRCGFADDGDGYWCRR